MPRDIESSRGSRWWARVRNGAVRAADFSVLMLLPLSLSRVHYDVYILSLHIYIRAHTKHITYNLRWRISPCTSIGRHSEIRGKMNLIAFAFELRKHFFRTLEVNTLPRPSRFRDDGSEFSRNQVSSFAHFWGYPFRRRIYLLLLSRYSRQMMLRK